jgi:hypothetical protein
MQAIVKIKKKMANLNSMQEDISADKKQIFYQICLAFCRKKGEI